jgi:hypothetical protein
MARLLDGYPDDTVCRLLPVPDGLCPATIRGTIADYPAVAIVTRHLLVIRAGGKPPAHAIPTRPGSTRMFYLGSDVSIELVTKDS